MDTKQISLTAITEIDGKKLPKSHVNLLAKLATVYSVTLPEKGDVRQNPYTGARHSLTPLATALYDFIIENYRKGLVKGATMASLTNPKAIPTQVWDSSRHLFLAYWPKEYFDLID
jgi:p-aminobenzoyl-glutamate transporter AbgT